MASSSPPESSRPLTIAELRQKRAASADYGLQIYSTLEVGDQGPRFCFFQKPNRFALDSDEQMIAVTPQALFMAFVSVQAAWYGMTVQFGALPVPGMPPGLPGAAAPPT